MVDVVHVAAPPILDGYTYYIANSGEAGLGLSQLFYFYSIQNFPQNAPIIPKDCTIILDYSHQKLRKVATYKNRRV